MNAALEPARLEVERAEEASGVSWLDTVQSLWRAGMAQDSARAAARSARALYEGLVALRDRAIESLDEEHELALQVVEVANRLAGRGTAESIEQLEDAASYSTIVRGAYESATLTAKLVGAGLVLLAVFVIWRATR